MPSRADSPIPRPSYCTSVNRTAMASQRARWSGRRRIRAANEWTEGSMMTTGPAPIAAYAMLTPSLVVQ